MNIDAISVETLPEMISVVSSQISQVGYKPHDKTMFIRFVKGGLYSYANISQEQFDEFKSSSSIGSEFYKKYKSCSDHPFTKIVEIKPEDNQS